MLKQRIITGLILAPIALAAVFWLPPVFFSVFIGLIIMVAGWEWANLAGFEHQAVRVIYAGLLGSLCFLATFYAVPPVFLLILSVVWWGLAFVMVKKYPCTAIWNPGKLMKLLMGIIVLVPAWMAIVSLKNGFGALSIILVLLLVWAADVGAYFVGKQFGRHKLAEAVSPKKTIEGLLGGVCLSIVVAVVAGLSLNFSFGRGLGLMVLAIMVALVSVAGDLLESLLKRERGIKDSSNLLPGHGGILDRIDSLTAALPVFTLALMASGS